MSGESGAPGRPGTDLFEFTTAMAFLEFSRQQVDWAIVETGMGGRLDATNVVTPELSIITNISLEHQTYLGKTITQLLRKNPELLKRINLW